MAEVLPAELRPDAGLPGEFQDLLLEFAIAKGAPVLVALAGKTIEIVAAGHFHGLQIRLGRGPPDNDCQVVGRAGGGSQQSNLLGHELEHALGVEKGTGLLEQEGLVGGPPTLGHEEEVVFIATRGIEIDLGGQVRPGVLFVVHAERRHLGVTETRFRVGPVDSPGKPLFIAPRRKDLLPLLPHHDRGARVLAGGQYHAGRNVRILQHLECHEMVVLRRFGIVEDMAQLRKVTRPEQMGDVTDRRRRQIRESRPLDDHDLLATKTVERNVVALNRPIDRFVGRRLEKGLVVELGHESLSGGAIDEASHQEEQGHGTPECRGPRDGGQARRGPGPQARPRPSGNLEIA